MPERERDCKPEPLHEVSAGHLTSTAVILIWMLVGHAAPGYCINYTTSIMVFQAASRFSQDCFERLQRSPERRRNELYLRALQADLQMRRPLATERRDLVHIQTLCWCQSLYFCAKTKKPQHEYESRRAHLSTYFAVSMGQSNDGCTRRLSSVCSSEQVDLVIAYLAD